MCVYYNFTGHNGRRYQINNGSPDNPFYLRAEVEGRFQFVRFTDDAQWQAVSAALGEIMRLALPGHPSLEPPPDNRARPEEA